MFSKNLAVTFVVLVAFFFSFDSTAQQSKLWGRLQPGKYYAGYYDTVVFKNDEPYQYGDHRSGKPFFIGIWIPIDQRQRSSRLKFSDYFDYNPKPGSKMLIDSMTSIEKSFLIGEICSNRALLSVMPFGKGEKALYEKILNTETNAYRLNSIPSKKFPVVIYHHGAGSIPQDNTVMFEYLASHGYVVISSNYHLPVNGADRYDSFYASGKFSTLTDVEFITDFAKHLPYAEPQNFYYSGHSWGAGTGLLLNEKGKHNFKKFVLLESTIEDYPWQAVRELWPHMDSLLRNHSDHFKTPTWLISAPKDYYEEGIYVLLAPPAFEVFKSIPSITKINARVPMNHDSFVSIGPMKQVYAKEFYQPDALYTKRELDSYFDVTELVLLILQGNEMDQGKWMLKK
jgi:pimeloyl-ACP methyl ester carboxylesterase